MTRIGTLTISSKFKLKRDFTFLILTILQGHSRRIWCGKSEKGKHAIKTWNSQWLIKIIHKTNTTTPTSTRMTFSWAGIQAASRNTNHGKIRWCGTTFWLETFTSLLNEKSGSCRLSTARSTSKTLRILVKNLPSFLLPVEVDTLLAQDTFVAVSIKRVVLQILSK